MVILGLRSGNRAEGWHLSSTQKGCSERTARRDYFSCQSPQALGHLWQLSSSPTDCINALPVCAHFTDATKKWIRNMHIAARPLGKTVCIYRRPPCGLFTLHVSMLQFVPCRNKVPVPRGAAVKFCHLQGALKPPRQTLSPVPPSSRGLLEFWHWHVQ